MSNNTIPAYIAERIRRGPPEGCSIVPGSTPVIAFGPVRRATVATLGLNPSKNEFLDSQSRELDGPLRRLETMRSLGIASLADASDAAVAQILAGCDTYFQRNPYRRWFDQLQVILDPLNVSYAEGSTVHLDLVQWATDPIWRHLDAPTISRLLHEDAGFLRQQLENERIDVLLLNGRSVINHLQWAFNMALQPVSTNLSSGRLATEIVVGSGIGRCTIIGWSTNLQSSFGVTRELRQQLAAVVATLVADARAHPRNGGQDG
ncbi:MAG: hypothetical protein H0T53_15045 [Herpetosiphonaceae bacterium]|nr:hypothetical protein [Herpetosiphonaceae bacterium]